MQFCFLVLRLILRRVILIDHLWMIFSVSYSIAYGGGDLIKPFSLEEVKAAFWNCDNFNGPCPKGINFSLIKDFWHELKGDIMRYISEFHCNGRSMKGINYTFIISILKIDSPQRLNDFRPNFLVGSLNKILAKLLASRLWLVIIVVLFQIHN